MADDVEGDAAFYKKREEDERELARKAGTDEIRQIHLELAARYAERAKPGQPKK